MINEIKDLIDISRYYGANKDFTLAGGGNTSYKNDEFIWIKASGATLATITEEGFAQLYRMKVRLIGEKLYSEDEQVRELEIKEDLMAANILPEAGKRPSVETSFHELINYAFVVHMHPTITNSLMCAKNSKAETKRLFGEEAMYVPYAPGYPLFMKVKEAIGPYRITFNKDPKLIFLENHGVFVSANTIQEIKELYTYITDTITSEIKQIREIREIKIKDDVTDFLPYLRMKLSDERAKIAIIKHTSLHSMFYKHEKEFKKISLPFTPDIIVYCKSAYLYIEENNSPEAIIESFNDKLDEFVSLHGYKPKLVLVNGYGLIAVEESIQSAEIALEVFEDLMKISMYSESFGGPRFLSKNEIAFIDSWEVENYRRKISKGEGGHSELEQKVIIVTGAAQGFGEGIAENLVLLGANIIVADLNAEKGRETADRLSSLCKKNRVMYNYVDVSDPLSVESLVSAAVKMFGGLDVLISNAGILFAGGVDELDPEIFKKMTEVNYTAWYYCVRAASKVMKIQHGVKKDYTMDLIQINSKSGLAGSKMNFAYSGAKFGGIGLTQSFALELAPYGIKVNSVCPGNFFEGPLWADPEKGLFVQYLRAGKVPGAKSIEDVKAFYAAKVPLNRGCRVEDVMKAIYYIIDQKYETGQALPVTGGQIMLN